MSRLTLAMVALFAVLAAGVFALEKTNPAPPANATTYVLNVPNADVQRIDVTTAAGTASFERIEPIGWTFATTGVEADSSRVSSVVNRIAQLRSSSKVSDNVTDLSPYRLNPPVDTAVLTLKNGTTQKVLVGSKTVNDAAYYAMQEGGKELHTINTLVVGDLEKLVSDPPVPQPTPTQIPTSTPRGTPGATPSPTRPAGTPGPTEEPTPTIGLPFPSVP
jgi:hypothetical protein